MSALRKGDQVRILPEGAEGTVREVRKGSTYHAAFSPVREVVVRLADVPVTVVVSEAALERVRQSGRRGG